MATLTVEAVRSALAAVPYPGFSRDIVSFGVVRDVAVDGGAVTVALQATTRDEATLAELRRRVEEALRALAGIEGVEVEMSHRAPPRG